jgi:hypothetical protein
VLSPDIAMGALLPDLVRSPVWTNAVTYVDCTNSRVVTTNVPRIIITITPTVSCLFIIPSRKPSYKNSLVRGIRWDLPFGGKSSF